MTFRERYPSLRDNCLEACRKAVSISDLRASKPGEYPEDNLRFSGESTAFGIGETKAPPTHALLKHAILFLEILNYIQLMAVYPTCEHQEEHLNRLKQ